MCWVEAVSAARGWTAVPLAFIRSYTGDKLLLNLRERFFHYCEIPAAALSFCNKLNFASFLANRNTSIIRK